MLVLRFLDFLLCSHHPATPFADTYFLAMVAALWVLLCGMLMSTHSPETSMADYALPCDAFRGLSPTDKSSWAAVGAAFNTKVFGAVEAMFAGCVQGVADQVK
jgi:hypothetical protein